MSSVSVPSPFAKLSNDANFNVLSFLEVRSLARVTCVGRQFRELAYVFQMRQSKTETPRVTNNEVKLSEQSEKAYDSLVASRAPHLYDVTEEIGAHATVTSRLMDRTCIAASKLLDFPMPAVHYHSTGQSGWLNGREVPVYRSTSSS